jgi:hypothetical protein
VAASVIDADSGVTVSLPAVGRVHLPPGPHLAFYAGLGLLGALEVVEWPIIVLLGVGKALADNRSHTTLQEFGDSLESA